MVVICITVSMKTKMRVGEKGQVVIPKEIRERTGIKEGTEVVVDVSGADAVSIRRAGPPADSYVEYFTRTFSKKPRRVTDIRRLLEEERNERQISVR